jgi:hypothetical protein
MTTLIPKYTRVTTANRTIDEKFAECISVKDYGATGDGVTDDTAAIQATIDFCKGQQKVYFPQGNYLVTSTLNLYKGSQLEGINNYQGFNDYSAGALATKITFNPAVLSDLFVIQNLPLPVQTWRSKVSIKGFELLGNGAVTTRSALRLTDSIYNDFENLNISSFQYGIFLDGTPINNRFVNIIISGNSAECVHYDAGGTTDVWEQCTFNRTPRGVVLRGNCIAMRFSNCIFEELDIYGIEIDKECRAIQAIACYGENVPLANTSTNAMFKVSYTGTTSDLSTTLQVVGGNYTGRNAGTVGSFLDVDDSVGVQLVGPYVARYTNLIKTTASTANYAVACSAIQFNSCTNTLAGTAKVSGTYDLSAVNAGFGPAGVFNSVSTVTCVATNGFTTFGGATWTANNGSPEGVITAPVGSLYSRLDGGVSTTLYVKTSGTGNTGWTAK